MMKSLKSFSLAYALVNNNIDLDSAMSKSRLDVDFQIRQWGETDEHRLDKLNMASDLEAAFLLHKS